MFLFRVLSFEIWSLAKWGLDITAWWVRSDLFWGICTTPQGKIRKFPFGPAHVVQSGVVGVLPTILLWRAHCCCVSGDMRISPISPSGSPKKFVNFEIYPFLGPQILPTVLGPKNVRNPKLLNTLGLEVSCTPKTYHPKHRSPQEMWLED